MDFINIKNCLRLFTKLYFFIILGLILITQFACSNSEICLSNQHAVQVGIVKKLATSDKDTLIDSISVYGVNLQNDSIYKNEKLSKLFLPLSFTHDTTSFVFTKGTIKDTILFVHSKELDFISGECGYVFKFSLDTIICSKHYVDSVAIAYPNINYNEVIRNVKIYID